MIHAERCSDEPWPGSVLYRSGTDIGAVALWFLVTVVRRSTSRLQPIAEAFGAPLVAIALVQLAGTRRVIALWLLEQR